MTIDRLPPPSRSRIDAHLAAIDHALREAGVAESQRLGVRDDLTTQIDEMLVEHGASPTAEDVEGVLARLDRPADFVAAWSPAPGEQPAPKIGMEVAARFSFWCAVGGIPAGIVVGMIASAAAHDGGLTGFLLFMGLEATAILAGIAARRHQLGRAGIWIGLGLIVATFACTLFSKHPHPAPPAEQSVQPLAP